jgi:thymidylate synthase
VKIDEWPILYKDILRVKDPTHHVGVCSLWTTRDVVQKVLADVPYNVIGNLYSAQGINAMIRNVMANPHIRVIVVWGSEMSLSGHSLIQLMAKGVDEGRQIRGARGEIEKEIPDAVIELFRTKVKVIDLRGRDANTLNNEVKMLADKRLKPFAASPRIFPKAEPAIQVMPSEQTGFRVSGKTVAQTWLKLLNEIYKYGRPKHTRYSQNNELKEILNLTAVVTAEDPEKEYFPEYLPFTLPELKSYYAELLTAREIPGVAYNYGKLLRKDFGINQINEVKKLLMKRPDSKKMAMTLIWPEKYWHDAKTSDTPCLTQIFGSVQDKKFFLTAHFRSQDMVHGWPRNTFALRKLQKDIADFAGYPMGFLTMITHSAHMYGDDFQLAENLLMDWYEKELGYTPAVHFDFDLRGNVVVEVIKAKDAQVWPGLANPASLNATVGRRATTDEATPYAVTQMLKYLPDKGKGTGKLIKATLMAPDGGMPIKIFEGRTAQEVAWQITDGGYLRDPAHAMYVGQELQKAEDCIIRGEKYFQDPA